MPGEGHEIIEVPRDITVLIYKPKGADISKAATSLCPALQARTDLLESGEAELIRHEVVLAKDGVMHPHMPMLCLLTPIDSPQETIWDVLAARLLEAYEAGRRSGNIGGRIDAMGLPPDGRRIRRS